jgi:HSP20 family molecular chaperone IbpA
MEKDTGARTDTEDVMGKYGWFKPSDSCKTLWPAKQGETKTQYEEPRAELLELPNEIILYLELPGVRREDIKINASEGHIDVTIEKKHGSESGTAGSTECVYSCRHAGFSGYYALPARIKPEEIKATSRDGLLEIRAQKGIAGGGKE